MRLDQGLVSRTLSVPPRKCSLCLRLCFLRSRLRIHYYSFGFAKRKLPFLLLGLPLFRARLWLSAPHALLLAHRNLRQPCGRLRISDFISELDAQILANSYSNPVRLATAIIWLSTDPGSAPLVNNCKASLIHFTAKDILNYRNSKIKTNRFAVQELTLT